MNENRIGINNSPHEFNKIYKGQYNGIRFILTHNKLYENEYEESEYSIDINWIDFLEEDRQAVVNEAVIKIFKMKLERGMILQD